MKGGFWKLVFLVVAAGLLAAGWLLAAAASWKQTRLAELAAGAEPGPVLQYADRGEGFPVLVLHGAPGGYDQALAVAEGLGLEGFRVIAPSRPGFLGSPPGPELTPAQQADQLAAFLDETGAGRAAVVGFSTGAPVALQLAARHPEKVAALAVVSGIVAPLPQRNAGGVPPMPMQILLGLGGDVGSAVYAWLLERDFPRAVGLALPLWYGGSEGDARALKEFIVANPGAAEAFRSIAESVLPVSPRESGTHQDLLLARMPGAPPVPPESVPVLFVHGTEDAFAPMEAVREFAARRAGIRFAAVEKGGHLLWIGPDGGRAADMVRGFLAEAAETAPASPKN